ncbi:agmatine deiminase family protein [Thiohalomonas denitrificans]|uniref:Agmatine deiminase n=1 Tax=Thiohalomonas denitrificans TaxID=415747 RepID=A0A1G5R0Z1_9GAMM|nr:agmatine deiminase family protein [Thiohalomonas denitrificans]SCZ67712.1 agmatine deiminase [Thiohalomonas denitrificans]
MNGSNVRLPAEWERQDGLLLTWPHAHSDWGDRLAEVEPVFVAITRAVAEHERVLISCFDPAHRTRVRQLLEKGKVSMDRVALFTVPSNDVWVRDHGPVTVIRNGSPLLLDFGFNGWGRKYEYRLDNQVSRNLERAGAFGDTPMDGISLILEGGSIESDGAGTLLTTSYCLLSPQRNPQYDCADLEAAFAREFGTRRVLWLKKGLLSGDDTDGHIDTLARFCDPATIAYVACTDPNDPDYPELAAMEAELKEFRTEDGAPYRLVPLPLPAPKYDEQGDRLPATHANFLIINDAVLVPTYDDPSDAVAMQRLGECFPDQTLIAIDALPLIRQYGSIHCATMQLPAGTLDNRR